MISEEEIIDAFRAGNVEDLDRFLEERTVAAAIVQYSNSNGNKAEEETVAQYMINKNVTIQEVIKNSYRKRPPGSSVASRQEIDTLQSLLQLEDGYLGTHSFKYLAKGKGLSSERKTILSSDLEKGKKTAELLQEWIDVAAAMKRVNTFSPMKATLT